MPDLIAALKPALLPWLDRPFALLGHSMGAWISFELARSLQQDGRSPAHLFVSGRQAPQLPSRVAPIYTLPDTEFLTGMRDVYSGIPAAVLENAELLDLFLPLLRMV